MDDEATAALAGQVALITGGSGGIGRAVAGRLGHPDEVADLALAILRNGYLTNQVISLDGGIYPR